MRFTTRQKGFTLIEIVVVLAIMVIIISIGALGLRNYAQYQRFEQEVALMRATFFDTRTDARSAVNDEAHGVKFIGNTVVQFSGDTYVAGDPSNETVTFNAITITPVLTAGADEIVFSKLSGIPDVTGSVTLSGVHYVGSSDIEISAAGVIQ